VAEAASKTVQRLTNGRPIVITGFVRTSVGRVSYNNITNDGQ